jgi:hypothetical protein
METERRIGRWVALGTVLAVVAAGGGFGALGAGAAAATPLTTCTKVSNGKTKIITAGGTAKCAAKDKGVARTWDDRGGGPGNFAAFGVAKSEACSFGAAVTASPTLSSYAESNGPFLAVVGAASTRCGGSGPTPPSITTCTKVSNGKTKVITAAGTAKCAAKGKGVVQTWDNHEFVAALGVAKTEACFVGVLVAFDGTVGGYYVGNTDPAFNASVDALVSRCNA